MFNNMLLKNPSDIRNQWLIEPFFNFLNDSQKRTECQSLIKIFQAPTGFGKTFAVTNFFIPELFNKDVNLVVYAAPNVENIDSDSFVISGQKYGYFFTKNPDEAFRFLKQGHKVVLGLTHSYLCNASKKCQIHRNQLIELASNSAWFIEECHSWLGVTDQEWYKDVIGHSTPHFGGTVYKLSNTVLSKTDLVFGITATPTKQHRGVVGDVCFEIVNEWCPGYERPLLTKWSKNYTEYNGYILEKSNGKTRAVINGAVAEEFLVKYVEEHHVSNIKKLNHLKTYDSNVVSKLTSLIVCGGNNNSRLSVHIEDALDHLVDILIDNGYNSSCQWISIMTDKQKGFYNLQGDFTSASEDDIIASLNDSESDCQFLLVNNKGKAGINVFNLTGICSLRIRAPKTRDCTELSRQIIGRLTRLNSGHGDILAKEYDYNLEKMCLNYCSDFEVDSNVFYETLKLANTFEFYYPSTPNEHWELSVSEFEEYYTPSWTRVKSTIENLIFKDKLCSACPLQMKFKDAYEGQFDNFSSLDKFFSM